MYHFGKYHSIGIDKKGMINKNAFHAFFSLLASSVCYVCILVGTSAAAFTILLYMKLRIGNTSVWHIWPFWCILPSTYLHLSVCHQVRINVVMIVSKLSIKNKQRSPGE